MIIKLSENDPIIKQAMTVDSPTLIEVGFIPDDPFGCKIYAKRNAGRLTIIGIHSRNYGCPKSSLTDSVRITSDV